MSVNPQTVKEIAARQPKDACCLNCRHHKWRIDKPKACVGFVYYSCWKHDWESHLLPSSLRSAERDAAQYCCTLWVRSWKSRWEKVRRVFCGRQK